MCPAPAGTRSRVAPVQPEGGSARPKVVCRECLQSGGHCSRVPPWRELLDRIPSRVMVKSTPPRGLSCDHSRGVQRQGGHCGACTRTEPGGSLGEAPLLVTTSAAAPARSQGDGTDRLQAPHGTGRGDRTGWGWAGVRAAGPAFLQAGPRAGWAEWGAVAPEQQKEAPGLGSVHSRHNSRLHSCGCRLETEEVFLGEPGTDGDIIWKRPRGQ